MTNTTESSEDKNSTAIWLVSHSFMEDTLFLVEFAMNSVNRHEWKQNNTLSLHLKQHFIWKQGVNLELPICKTEKKQGSSFQT